MTYSFFNTVPSTAYPLLCLRHGSLMLELRPYDNKYGYGVTIASTDLDENGIDEIITGLGFGPQNAAWVKVFKADGTEITSFLAYPENIGYGVKVSTGKTGE